MRRRYADRHHAPDADCPPHQPRCSNQRCRPGAGPQGFLSSIERLTRQSETYVRRDFVPSFPTDGMLRPAFPVILRRVSTSHIARMKCTSTSPHKSPAIPVVYRLSLKLRPFCFSGVIIRSALLCRGSKDHYMRRGVCIDASRPHEGPWAAAEPCMSPKASSFTSEKAFIEKAPSLLQGWACFLL